MNTIDLEQFEKAIISLHKILERYEREKEDIDIRDAVIKRFEYTYSTAVRIIMRYLSYTSPESDDILSFNEAIRRANQAGILLTNLEKWSEFRKNRNITSHLYDEEAIESIINIIKKAFDERLNNYKLYLFGSRAKGRARKYSDIDLAVDSPELTDKIKSDLEIYFTDSTIPYEIDIVDLNNISEKFKNIISDDLVEI